MPVSVARCNSALTLGFQLPWPSPTLSGYHHYFNAPNRMPGARHHSQLGGTRILFWRPGTGPAFGTIMCHP